MKLEQLDLEKQKQSLEINKKLLEIDNQRLLSTIELNNKELEVINSLLDSLSPKKASNEENNEINLEFKWKISKERETFICELKNDSKTIKKISNNGSWNCTAIGDKNLIKGKINKWKIQTNSDFSSILVGIIPSNIDLNGISNNIKGYSTNLNNFNKHNLTVYTEFCNMKTQKGDIVEIIVDLSKEKGELSYSLNGKKTGIFCDDININENWAPFVDMYYVNTEITLLD